MLRRSVFTILVVVGVAQFTHAFSDEEEDSSSLELTGRFHPLKIFGSSLGVDSAELNNSSEEIELEGRSEEFLNLALNSINNQIELMKNESDNIFSESNTVTSKPLPFSNEYWKQQKAAAAIMAEFHENLKPILADPYSSDDEKRDRIIANVKPLVKKIVIDFFRSFGSLHGKRPPKPSTTTTTTTTTKRPTSTKRPVQVLSTKRPSTARPHDTTRHPPANVVPVNKNGTEAKLPETPEIKTPFETIQENLIAQNSKSESKKSGYVHEEHDFVRKTGVRFFRR